MSTKEQKLVPNARMTSSTSRPININCCLEIVFEKSKHITGIWAKIRLLKKYLHFVYIKCRNFVIVLAQP